ncbi:DUF1963 domain-containing protein [Kocuria dechangensis]|nr:DUF1963 domain-containing protein [Kocuria dechangensis]
MKPRRRDGIAPAPLHGPWGQIQTWLEAGPAEDEHFLEQVAYSPVLSEQSFAPGAEELTELWCTGGWISWLGGPAAAPLSSWPRRNDGKPLSHVLTVDLADLDAVLDAQGKAVWPHLREGLPTHGVLEVFHDLQTSGYGTGDRRRRGWLVRWVSAPQRTGLVQPPADLEEPTAVCQPVIPLPGFTLPPAADAAGGPVDRFEVAAALEEQLLRSWMLLRTGSTAGPAVPISHVYGHSQRGEINARALLERLLPLTVPGDQHRLILEVEGVTALDGWFGDSGHMEVWMRDSDLAARDFEASWCLVRND